MPIPSYETDAQKSYGGPDQLRVFADILPFIGEIVISFSRLERQITWAIESILYSTADEAYEMEDFVKNFSSRLKFLELTGRAVARETNTENEFEDIIARIQAANKFRNQLIHGAFPGIQQKIEGGTSVEIAVKKGRYSPKPEKRSSHISTKAMRDNSKENFDICGAIRSWITTVRPNAERRVP